MHIVFASSLSKPNEFDQIKDFLQNHGPGLQHIAFHCDILNSIERAKEAEVSFISPPSNYYDRPHAKKLLSVMKNGLKVKETGLLVDHDELDSSKILLQAFTKPVSNGGLFFELIQRINNSQGQYIDLHYEFGLHIVYHILYMQQYTGYTRIHTVVYSVW